MISVKNLVDLYGKDELIYLGPDEQVIDRMSNIIAIGTVEFFVFYLTHLIHLDILQCLPLIL